MNRSVVENGESAEYVELLADLVAQTQARPTDATPIRECCGERAHNLLCRLGSGAPTADCSARR